MTGGEGLLRIFGWGALVYLSLGLVIGGIAFALVSKDDHHWPLVVIGLGVWTPLLLTGPPAAVLAWRRAQRAAQQRVAADEAGLRMEPRR